MPETREVDPHDEAAFRAWYSVLREGAAAGRTAPLIATYDALASSLRDPGESLRRVAVAAVDEAQTVAGMLFELPLTENLDTVLVEIDVPARYRGRGVATALWRWATDRAAQENRTVFQSEVNIPSGETPETWAGARFAAKLGFVSENVEDHLVVPLPYDSRRPDSRGESPSPGYRLLSWAGRCPEHHLRAYADLQTEMAREVPTGGMTRQPMVMDVERVRRSDERLAESYLSLVTLATTTDGVPAGYTQIFVPHTDPENVMQDDTLVLGAHRGHNLGALLKSANLRLLERHHTAGRWLHTWTAETNAAMQKVNARFGFRPVEKMHEVELVLESR